MNRYLLPIMGTVLLAMAASASDIYVSPRTGEITFIRTDHKLPTPFGRLPITRSYDANEKAGILGPGWRLELLSEIRFLDQSRFAVVQAGIPVLFQKVRNLQRFEGPMGARASLEGKEWVVRSSDGSSSRYDEKGREILRTDSNGNKISFAYDAGGRVSEIAAVAGFALKFRYGANGRLAAIADSCGRNSEYQYDASRRLSQVRDADGWATIFSYDAGSRLSGIQFPSGEKVQLAYDGSNRVSAY
jgi:YD repeat-containing protein